MSDQELEDLDVADPRTPATVLLILGFGITLGIIQAVLVETFGKAGDFGAAFSVFFIGISLALVWYRHIAK
ncbi:hypothetical protein A2853_01925 [Candidatus Kaiserbacteria bacterium RIFCSPHIGHO2_01_FULL_55_17]|uniref:Uncharacterized protein n=1 Tax=Candidatus Kaiserbacteria bacterium RIFCSPHIGHO2_01_FULL_55_17 TaxID=1798484 RepID=A0A1F6D876_9BACT|nr:MAG: hypothetical protein A2853_01925 [Candidatus Kaiserbacteria bacterium RIFCSPHIGHO2_01_FULL_55_17]